MSDPLACFASFGGLICEFPGPWFTTHSQPSQVLVCHWLFHINLPSFSTLDGREARPVWDGQGKCCREPGSANVGWGWVWGRQELWAQRWNVPGPPLKRSDCTGTWKPVSRRATVAFSCSLGRPTNACGGGGKAGRGGARQSGLMGRSEVWETPVRGSLSPQVQVGCGSLVAPPQLLPSPRVQWVGQPLPDPQVYPLPHPHPLPAPVTTCHAAWPSKPWSSCRPWFSTPWTEGVSQNLSPADTWGRLSTGKQGLACPQAAMS